ncbi:hypothetical protein NQ318_022358 [Aromia moschata]|uniref:G patch domain-containing protein 4 n=1 Tax=Aromia moschata TaxID=1265417 RepID=A0AAV8Z7C8_9CUCU|nr:hypothetical protein NQ318_022358 [Aromia moschata]
MNFARKQLEKYGWSEGKGLGKNEDGISSPLKPKLKFDNTGVGHVAGEQFTNNWWEKLFNNAADNLDVNIDENQVKMKTKSDDSVEITTQSYSIKQLKKNKHLHYGSFIRTEKLTDGGVENYNVTPFDEPEPIKPFQTLTDEELLAACGGRTAHKGARHGLKLTGKLSRIEKQEKMLLRKMKKVSLSDEKEQHSAEKKLKKLKKQKEDNREKYTPIVEDSMESTSSCHLKKSNKKRKSVSFNETVTRIMTHVDWTKDFESEIGSVRDENSNDPMLENAASGSDEGIEQDIENKNNDPQDDHRSFEEAQFNVNDLSKAERKKLKKKRKLEAKRNTSTEIFLRKLSDDIEVMLITDFDDKDVNLKKRKFLNECDHRDCKRIYSKTESPERNRSQKNKKKRKTQKKLEEKQINSIVKSMDSFCRISESE